MLMSDIPELTEEQFARAIPARVRKRLVLGQFESGEDIAALRRFVGLAQTQFALAMGISVHTIRNWEQGRRHPEGPAIAFCASRPGIRGSFARMSRTLNPRPELSPAGAA